VKVKANHSPSQKRCNKDRAHLTDGGAQINHLKIASHRESKKYFRINIGTLQIYISTGTSKQGNERIAPPLRTI
jgi:hypothetical protein